MTRLITVFGIVQGVGYRPFVARLAEELSLTGTIMNCGGIVQIIANAPSDAVFTQFTRRLEEDQPPGANVIEIRTRILPDQRMEGFHIIPSGQILDPDGPGFTQGLEHPLIPTDLPLCGICKQELYDPANRRYLYPFISCVACGPRYSIIKELPYDRDTVTMDIFPMCPACEKEYTGNENRRRHAQTISCHDCGPRLILDYHGKVLHRQAALLKAVVLLQQGNVLAVKGIGGYQFACLPSDSQAVDQLRLLKLRDKKPFAVMFPNLEKIREFCEINTGEETLLLSTARPIVLLDKKPCKDFTAGVCGESRQIGAFLPYTPLHQLLTDACGPLVMTSGNLTSNPIIYRDEEMRALKSPYLAGVLYNERRITTPLDDSVARFVSGTPQVVRRSRGYVPVPLVLEQAAETPVLAMGGDLKGAFCLYHNRRAYVSQYFGDMENQLVSETYQENIGRMESLFGIYPEIIARDLHPHYFTTLLAERLSQAGVARAGESEKTPPVPIIPVQHHHAHAASVMAEHDLSSCIGVVFDGTGYGTDGAIWGGEFLLCRAENFERRAHLGYVTLAGGDAVARNTALAAQCYLIAAEIPETTETRGNIKGKTAERALLRSAIEHGINTSKSSSMGRLFDAVSAILGIRQENTFEGECAIALETEAEKFAETRFCMDQLFPPRFASEDNPPTPNAGPPASETGLLHFKICKNETGSDEIDSSDNRLINMNEKNTFTEILIDQVDLFRQVAVQAEAIAAKDIGSPERARLTGVLAYAFHKAVAEMIVQVCEEIRDESKENTVVLSGGVFANRLLLQSAMLLLQEAGFEVFINAEVPTNDGGISLGQAWIAARQSKKSPLETAKNL